MNELVTVYIPTHNRSAMLKRAVESVLKQSHTNIEIIISDDGSTDDTELVVKQIQEKNSNIIYLRNLKAMGACHARNSAIKIAKGEYITGLDDDDEFTSNRIEELLLLSKEKSNYSFISSGILRIEKKGVGYNYIKPREITSEMIRNSNCVGNQVFVKTEYLRGIGGFDENLIAWQDYDCWLRLILRYGKGYNCASFNYIMHTEHESGRITKSEKVGIAVEYFVRKHASVLSAENIKNIYFNFDLYYTKKMKILSLCNNLTINNIKLYGRYIAGNMFNFMRNSLSFRGVRERV